MKISICVLVVAMLLAGNAHATKGERNGLVFGFGLGYGNSSADDSTKEESGPGLAMNVKIGYAPSDRLMVYWVNQSKDRRGSDGADTFISGFGASWFLHSDSPALFFTAALGSARVDWYGEAEDSSPFGFSLGIGYELFKHFTVEAYTFQVPGDEPRVASYAVTLNWLGY